MKTFRFSKGSISGTIEADSFYEAAHLLLDDPQIVKDHFGQHYTNPTIYVGTRRGLNSEIHLWEEASKEVNTDEKTSIFNQLNSLKTGLELLKEEVVELDTDYFERITEEHIEKLNSIIKKVEAL